jgi:hypothetical protein
LGDACRHKGYDEMPCRSKAAHALRLEQCVRRGASINEQLSN